MRYEMNVIAIMLIFAFSFFLLYPPKCNFGQNNIYLSSTCTFFSVTVQ